MSLMATDRRRLGGAFLLILGAVVLGVVADLLLGLPVARAVRSPLVWFLGVGGLGTLWMLGESGTDWMSRRDRVSDPLLKRFVRLEILLVFWGAFGVALWAFLRVFAKQ